MVTLKWQSMEDNFSWNYSFLATREEPEQCWCLDGGGSGIEIWPGRPTTQ